MSKPIVTVVASLAAALVGGWLMLAPFALGYRHAGTAWNHPTEVDFWTGVGVVVLALVALAASLASIRTELRVRGALPQPLRRAERQERKAAARAAKAAALAGQAGAGTGQGAPGGGPGGGPPTSAELRELLAPLVVALLSDLKTTEAETSGQAGNHLSGADPRPAPRTWS